MGMFLFAPCVRCAFDAHSPFQLDRPCAPPDVPLTTGSTLRFVSYCQLVMAWMGFGICKSTVYHTQTQRKIRELERDLGLTSLSMSVTYVQ